MSGCRCPLCRLATWCARRFVGPVARPVVPPVLTFEEEIELWPATKIGELLHQLEYGDMLPGSNRERSRAMLAEALARKETHD